MHFQEFPVLHIRLADVLHHDLLVPAFLTANAWFKSDRPWEAFLAYVLAHAVLTSRATRKILVVNDLNLRFKNADKLNF